MSVSCDIIQVVRVIRVFVTVMHKLDERQVRNFTKASQSISIETLNDDWNTRISCFLNSFESMLCQAIEDSLHNIDVIVVEVPLGLFKFDVESWGCGGSNFPLISALHEFHVADSLIKGGDLEKAI